MLFVYMVVLFLIFIIQFSVSCACLSVSKEDELKIAEKVKLIWKTNLEAIFLVRLGSS